MHSNDAIRLTEGLLLSQGLIGFSSFGVINLELAKPLLQTGVLDIEKLPSPLPRVRPWNCARITDQGKKALKAAHKFSSVLPVLPLNELYSIDETLETRKLVFTKEFILSEIKVGRMWKIDRHYTEELHLQVC